MAMAGFGLGPAVATHSTVTAVQGSAFGYWADGVSLFGGAQADTGPTPTVALAADASNSPAAATAATGLVAYGPARLFTSDTITVNSTGSLGTSGSVTTTSDIQNVNYAATQPSNTGSEVFGYPPPETDPQYTNFNPNNLRTRVAGSATANGTGVSGTATITNGMVRTDAQSSTDCTAPINVNPCGRAGEQHTHGGLTEDRSEGVVTIPTNPPPNYKVAGHLHLGATTTDYFVIVFNEQVVNPDGSITVTPVHEYFGYKLDGNGNLVQDLAYTQGGSILHGHLYLGQVTAGVTKTAGANTAPVAGDDAYGTDYQTSLTVPAPGVLVNDTDADGGTLNASNASNPPGGSVTLNANGSFTYTPDAGFSGPDSFTYTVTDNHGATDTGTVTVTVGPAPPLPVADVAVSGSGPATLPISTRQVPSVGSYSFTVTNDGPEAANATTLNVRLAGAARVSPSNVTSTSGTCTSLKGKIKGIDCNFGTLAPGGTATVTFNVQAPTKPGTVTFTGTASTASSDPDSTNNSASVTTEYFR